MHYDKIKPDMVYCESLFARKMKKFEKASAGKSLYA